MLWQAQTFAEIIVPVESWCALLHELTLAAAGLSIPILGWWADHRNLAYTSALCLAPYLVHRADVRLWAHTATFLEAEDVRLYAFY